MQPNPTPVGNYLRGTVQLVIPRYQRPYEWDVEKHIDLWRDVSAAYRQLEADPSGAKGMKHFMGTVIFEDDGSTQGAIASRRLVVDGQQRLLTLLVLDAAIRDHNAYLKGGSVEPDNKLAIIRSDFDDQYVERVELEKAYKSVYQAIAAGEFVDEIPVQYAQDKLAQAYRFFRYQLWQGYASIDAWDPERPPRPRRAKSAPHAGSFEPWGDPVENVPIKLELLYGVLHQRLVLLEIVIGDSDETASVIFETMNSKSTPLRQFDHLRNSIFVCMPDRRDKFHAEYWQTVESTLEGISYTSQRKEPEEQFFYEYLIAMGERGVAMSKMHRAFMERVYKQLGYPATDEKAFEKDFAIPFAQAALLYPLALGQTRKTTIAKKVFEIGEVQQRLAAEILAISGGPPVPLVLRLLIAYRAGELSDADLTQGLMSIQSFLVRSMLAGVDFSPLRGTLSQVATSISSEPSVDQLNAALHGAGWPSDGDVLEAVNVTNLYSYGAASMFPVLRGIEHHLAKKGGHALPFGRGDNDYSVEHVFPQSEKPTEQWRKDLLDWGESADLAAMADRRHSLGNLTAVTKWDNSKNGRKPFAEKRELIERVAPIRLNDFILEQSEWTSSVIDNRSQLLAAIALKRWPRPERVMVPDEE